LYPRRRRTVCLLLFQRLNVIWNEREQITNHVAEKLLSKRRVAGEPPIKLNCPRSRRLNPQGRAARLVSPLHLRSSVAVFFVLESCAVTHRPAWKRTTAVACTETAECVCLNLYKHRPRLRVSLKTFRPLIAGSGQTTCSGVYVYTTVGFPTWEFSQTMSRVYVLRLESNVNCSALHFLPSSVISLHSSLLSFGRSVGIVMGYRLDGQGSILSRGKRSVSSP
jgi:hypothetical protein